MTDFGHETVELHAILEFIEVLVKSFARTFYQCSMKFITDMLQTEVQSCSWHSILYIQFFVWKNIHDVLGDWIHSLNSHNCIDLQVFQQKRIVLIMGT
jgi:hypothetical protein